MTVIAQPEPLYEDASGWANDLATTGDWMTEPESAAELDRRLVSHDLWHIYSEVRGVLIHPRPGQADKSVRIDRILIPNERLHAAGWRHGAIGIEIKRSGAQLGPPLAQAMDYTRAAWTMPHGVMVLLGAVFIWPMSSPSGPLASVMVHNRIGSATPSPWASVRLKLGEEGIFSFAPDGSFTLGSVNSGHKVGSR